jgi:hypothetical protein
MKKSIMKLGVVVQVYNPSSRKDEEEVLQVGG